ncbi:Aquaporin-1 [Psilocybe cubensis]|uniref:Aquaporin-like protein n=2 Tax=Psilocybe cubensis TaxID=181762 RepID=A0A8H8CHZ7_PSICU|nr:Aquaporin-1 [Psilocybe cubensis]KAH9474404.1 Aquaporin-1 [Psilocybe cubensis]
MRENFRWSSISANLGEDIAAAAFEFIGTVFFLLFGLGGIQAAAAAESTIDNAPSTGMISHIMYIATCMGLSLLVSAWLFFRVTGGLFNPNVSLALFLIGVLGPVRFVLYCIAQLVGGIAAAAIVRSLTSAPLGVNTSLTPQINSAQGVFIEMFITAALVIAVLMLAAEKHEATPFAPVGIGLTLFACHLFAVYYTGASMNTARSFGPAVVSGFPVPNHWIYWLGPFLGSILGTGIYALLKHYHYWDLTPHQATGDFEKSPDDPVEGAKRALTGKENRDDVQRDGASEGTSGFGNEERV